MRDYHNEPGLVVGSEMDLIALEEKVMQAFNWPCLLPGVVKDAPCVCRFHKDARLAVQVVTAELKQEKATSTTSQTPVTKQGTNADLIADGKNRALSMRIAANNDRIGAFSGPRGEQMLVPVQIEWLYDGASTLEKLADALEAADSRARVTDRLSAQIAAVRPLLKFFTDEEATEAEKYVVDKKYGTHDSEIAMCAFSDGVLWLQDRIIRALDGDNAKAQ